MTCFANNLSFVFEVTAFFDFSNSQEIAMESVVISEFIPTQQVEVQADVTPLDELQLVLIGGGIGDVVGH